MYSLFSIVTEKEIENGLLNAVDVENKALYFERNFQNIDNVKDFDKSILSKYLDLDSNYNIDKESSELLNQLKFEKIRKSLPLNNIFKFEVILFRKNF